MLGLYAGGAVLVDIAGLWPYAVDPGNSLFLPLLVRPEAFGVLSNSGARPSGASGRYISAIAGCSLLSLDFGSSLM